MLYGGGRHIDDLREIVNDRALRRLVGLKDIPSPSTVGDWLRRVGNGSGLDSLEHVIEKATGKALRLHDSNEYTLWSDPTLIEAEKREAKMSYKGFKGYKPILTAFKELPVIAYHRFRDGSAMGDTVEAIEAAYRVLPEDKRIGHALLDSEFYSAEVINFLMQKGTTFTIAVDKDHAVKEAIKALNGWRPFKTEEGEETDREIAETVHTMKETQKAFRLLVLRWKNKQGDLFNHEQYNYHAIATDLECPSDEVVWQYSDRGQMEGIIKELKLGVGMESLPGGDFGANSFWFSIGVLVYNTFVLQKTLLLPEEYRTKTIQTLRWSLIETAGKVIRHGGRLLLLLATTWDKYSIYFQMKRRCMAFT